MDSFARRRRAPRKVTIRRFLGLIGVIPNEVKDLMLNCAPRKGVSFAV